MNFLALILGLAVERLFTRLFHLREFRWLDALFNAVYARAEKLKAGQATAVVVLTVVLLVVPVAAAEFALADRLAYIPSFIFAVLVLLLCLGPRDLAEEVEDFRAAVATQKQQEINALASELLERPLAEQDAVPDVEHAIYAQANNRIFGVVFWFILLGAAGAWLFRVLDLMRHRAISRSGVVAMEEAPGYVQALLRVHSVLAWVPARLLAAGYTLAGNYDEAMQAWRSYRPAADAVKPRDNDILLGAVGKGAASKRDQGNVSARARIAVELVNRCLWMIWCPALALLTLYDWIN